MDRDQFWVIDGHGLIYRSIFRPGKPLTSPVTGEPTRGTHAFLKSLAAMVDRHRPAYLAMAVDAPRHSTFRSKLFEPYKAKRDEGEFPEEVGIQFTRIKQLTTLLGVPMVMVEGFEADDIMASFAKVCAGPSCEVVIASADKDLHQLVGPDVRVFDFGKEEWYDERMVEAKWGVPACKIVEVQTLMGDSTDGVPGVKGMGPKIATKLIQEHGSVEALVENTAALSESQAKNLACADLELCRKLVELRTDTPLAVSPSDLEWNGFDWASAEPLLRKLGFKSFL